MKKLIKKLLLSRSLAGVFKNIEVIYQF